MTTPFLSLTLEHAIAELEAELARPEIDRGKIKLIVAALAGQTDLIVTSDRDLLRLQAYQGIPIVRPMDFLRTLEASD